MSNSNMNNAKRQFEENGEASCRSPKRVKLTASTEGEEQAAYIEQSTEYEQGTDDLFWDEGLLQATLNDILGDTGNYDSLPQPGPMFLQEQPSLKSATPPPVEPQQIFVAASGLTLPVPTAPQMIPSAIPELETQATYTDLVSTQDLMDPQFDMSEMDFTMDPEFIGNPLDVSIDTLNIYQGDINGWLDTVASSQGQGNNIPQQPILEDLSNLDWSFRPMPDTTINAVDPLQGADWTNIQSNEGNFGLPVNNYQGFGTKSNFITLDGADDRQYDHLGYPTSRAHPDPVFAVQNVSANLHPPRRYERPGPVPTVSGSRRPKPVVPETIVRGGQTYVRQQTRAPVAKPAVRDVSRVQQAATPVNWLLTQPLPGRVPDADPRVQTQQHTTTPRQDFSENYHRITPPTSWGRSSRSKTPLFQYTHNGELLTNRGFTSSQLSLFIHGPQNNGLAPSRSRHAGMTIWIQSPPNFAAHRCPTNPIRCLWEDCPVGTRTIQKGQFRVCFDERPDTSGVSTDPFFNSGYMHLDCFERCVPLVRMINHPPEMVRVLPDFRKFSHPRENGLNPMALGSVIRTGAGEVFERWLRDATGKDEKARRRGRVVWLKGRDSLVWRLTEWHLQHVPQRAKGKVHMSDWMGDLRRWEELRRRAGTGRKQYVRKVDRPPGEVRMWQMGNKRGNVVEEEEGDQDAEGEVDDQEESVVTTWHARERARMAAYARGQEYE